ncbi:hypothetical protein CH362_19050 [Leptospira saintgironsiae]|uniref:Uncharacterized protein n=1 Tax=Leptospira saintgironsiae TaxID=2023183 RepID=A0A2M9Y7Q9_9LEPT|nr:hypothetical protein CH362_19050 [Leptospira saintgironsiae]
MFHNNMNREWLSEKLADAYWLSKLVPGFWPIFALVMSIFLIMLFYTKPWEVKKTQIAILILFSQALFPFVIILIGSFYASTLGWPGSLLFFILLLHIPSAIYISDKSIQPEYSVVIYFLLMGYLSLFSYFVSSMSVEDAWL